MIVTTKAVAYEIGTDCSGARGYNIDKLSIDPATRQTIVCGYDEKMDGQVWYALETPLIGIVESGSSCSASQKGLYARTTDDYLVYCADPGMLQGYIWISSSY